ncbi:protoporphyrinogen oxidase, partial [Kouleothrix aurantiaca]
PASAAAALLDTIEPGMAAPLRDIRYVSTATVSLAYPSAAIRAPLEGFGLVIPQSEGRRINALTITSKKFAGRAPDGYTLIRVFAGGARTPETAELDDKALLAVVRDELRSILQIDAAPLWSRTYRWPNGHPQYAIGHSERVATVEARLPAGLLLAGSSYRGVGLPDCIQQAQLAASAALEQLRVPTLA